VRTRVDYILRVTDASDGWHAPSRRFEGRHVKAVLLSFHTESCVEPLYGSNGDPLRTRGFRTRGVESRSSPLIPDRGLVVKRLRRSVFGVEGGCDLGARADVEFAVGVRQVRFDCALREE
jgi:hypothetical protein